LIYQILIADRSLIMSTVNASSDKEVQAFLLACNAASSITKGQITPFEFAFWDEVFFHNSANFSLAVYIGLPAELKPAVIGMLGQAIQQQDPYTL
jgi:hypothetical protein